MHCAGRIKFPFVRRVNVYKIRTKSSHVEHCQKKGWVGVCKLDTRVVLMYVCGRGGGSVGGGGGDGFLPSQSMGPLVFRRSQPWIAP